MCDKTLQCISLRNDDGYNFVSVCEGDDLSLSHREVLEMNCKGECGNISN